MKQTVKTSRTAGQLEKMFRELNAHYFNGELPEPIISLKKTPGAYGHFTCGKVWQAGTEHRYEINISTATLSRPIEDTTATLLHEMVHLYCYVHGIKDTSRGGTYHNKRFKETAETHGLIVHHHPKYGWTLTSPSDDLLDFILENGLTDILITRNEYHGISVSGTGTHSTGGEDFPPKKSSTRKYLCPCCGNSVRATKAVHIACLDCQREMLPA